MKLSKRLCTLPLLFTTASAWAHTVVYPHAHPHGETSQFADAAFTFGAVALLSLAVWMLARKAFAKSK